MKRKDFLATGMTALVSWPVVNSMWPIFPSSRLDPGLTAQGDELIWQKTGGPSGGLGYNVRYLPGEEQTIFVTDAWSGLYRSENAGRVWLQRSDGISARGGATNDNIPVFAFNVDPNDSDILWAGCQNDGGVYRSVNRGENWERRDTGLDFSNDSESWNLTIRDITVVPGDSNKVFVTGERHTHVRGDEFERVGGFLYYSDNGGTSFSLVREFDSLTRFLLIHPDNPDEMVLTTGIFDREADVDDPDGKYESGLGLGVFRSTDGGMTWSASNDGMDSGRSMFIGGAARSPHDPDLIVVTAGNNNDGNKELYGAVYRSTDGGQSWEDVTPDFGAPVTEAFTAVVFSPSDENRVYCGSAEAIYRSTDAGVTWARFTGDDGVPYGPDGVPSGFPIDMQVSESDPDKVYVNNYGGGVFLSRDGAESWENFSDGYTGAEIHSLSIHSDDPRKILATGRSGTFMSGDGGGDWTGVSRGVASYAEGQGVAFDPSDETGNTCLGSDAHAGLIVRTTDGGETWNEQLRLTDEEVGNRHGAKSIVFAPSDPSIVYAGFVGVGLITNPHNDGFGEGLGLYRSNDGGVTWEERNSGLPSGAGMLHVTDIAVSHQDPNRIYITMIRGGVWFSNDGGESWQDVMGALPSGEDWTTNWTPEDPINRESIMSLEVHPDDDQKVMIGTNLFGAYRSDDGGANWQILLDPDWITPQGTSDHAHIMSLVLDPVDKNTIYAADWHGGMYRGIRNASASSDWEQINDGLTNRAVESIQISADGQYLYAATQGEGVFRKTLRLLIEPPENLSLTLNDNGEVVVTWPAETNPDVTSYKLYRGTSPNALSEVDSLEPVDGSYTDQITEAGIYYYSMTSLGASDTVSDPSSLVGVVQLEESVDSKWDLISIPVGEQINHTDGLIYDFEQSYRKQSTLQPGRGYWVKSNESSTIAVGGPGVMSSDVEVQPGWNLIGGPAIDVTVASLKGENSPLSDASVYSYDKGSGAYQESTILRPRRGYWIHANEAGTLELKSSTDPSLSSVQPRERSELTGATLTLESGGEIREISILREGVQRHQMDPYLIPPKSPGRSFDVRSPGGFRAIQLQDDLLISNSQGPITLSLHSPLDLKGGISLELMDLSGEKIGGMSSGDTLVMDESLGRVRIQVSHTQLETAFHSVYPNPFRSETTLSFEVEESIPVQFEVYDMLGRRIARLPEVTYPAGHHTQTLDANGWASGVYVIRMKAGDWLKPITVTHIK